MTPRRHGYRSRAAPRQPGEARGSTAVARKECTLGRPAVTDATCSSVVDPPGEHRAPTRGSAGAAAAIPTIRGPLPLDPSSRSSPPGDFRRPLALKVTPFAAAGRQRAEVPRRTARRGPRSITRQRIWVRRHAPRVRPSTVELHDGPAPVGGSVCHARVPQFGLARHPTGGQMFPGRRGGVQFVQVPSFSLILRQALPMAKSTGGPAPGSAHWPPVWRS